MSNYHLHQQRQQQFQQSDINQQNNNNNNNLISDDITNPHSLYNILMISLTQLKPYTEYTIWARTVGEDGDTSLPNQPFLFTTKELGKFIFFSKTKKALVRNYFIFILLSNCGLNETMI